MLAFLVAINNGKLYYHLTEHSINYMHPLPTQYRK